MKNPLGYYLNNVCKARSLIDCAIKANVRHFIFSSTAAVYGLSAGSPLTEQADACPISPYGSSKLMTEIMLRDAGLAWESQLVNQSPRASELACSTMGSLLRAGSALKTKGFKAPIPVYVAKQPALLER